MMKNNSGGSVRIGDGMFIVISESTRLGGYTSVRGAYWQEELESWQSHGGHLTVKLVKKLAC